MSREERLKYEAARRLGLIEKLLAVGWGGLTSEENGRVGGVTAALCRKDAQGVRGVRAGV